MDSVKANLQKRFQKCIKEYGHHLMVFYIWLQWMLIQCERVNTINATTINSFMKFLKISVIFVLPLVNYDHEGKWFTTFS